MSDPSDVERLTDLFRRAGAQNPERWATSQIDEGINQLHRYLFLRQAWRGIVSEDDRSWMSKAVKAAEADPSAPFAGIGLALKRLRDTGASEGDLVDLVRGTQAQLLFHICYLLDDPSIDDRELSEVGWALVETDSEFEPTDRSVDGLHESILETDPTGREMRPRGHGPPAARTRRSRLDRNWPGSGPQCRLLKLA